MQSIIFTTRQIHDCYNKLDGNHHNMLNDNDILLLLQLLIETQSTIKIGLIDSQLCELIMNDYLNNKETNTKTLQTFLDYFYHKYDILTIPLCHDTHWNLLLYIRLYDKLIYIDSMGTYNYDYSNKFYSMLIKFNITIKDFIQIKSLRQEFNWECGYYLVLFFHLSMSVFKQRDKFGKEQFKGILESLLTRRFDITTLLGLFRGIIYAQIKRNEYNQIK